MFGEVTNPRNLTIKDLNAREIVVMAPLVALIFIMGVYPTPFISRMAPAIDRMISLSKGGQQTAAQHTAETVELRPETRDRRPGRPVTIDCIEPE